MDRLLVAAVATTVVSVLAAVAGVLWLVCGQPGTGDGDLPELAVGTEEEFCAAFLNPFPLMEDMATGAADFADNQVEYADRMAAAGLPRDVDAEVRRGLTVYAEKNRSIPSGALDDDLSTLDDLPELSESEDAAYHAFDDWARATCGAPY
ncbi:hypothetical protein [Nocardioides lianchengensis]|uniref:Uncharacterized protein n=1 Tax=Nocardioides lianchengensis TaxID=1045774 RepID=A0A1G6M2Y4_9ACTN|nr:hypothetical protein [Nocardioides lianchengensis]NYG12367.1 hypothetical protein [Nocardioides lianchengensis]SDC49902.1 hypothetical protein SAMN05421872_102437 [Nocardioides lianchengensis]